MKLSGWGRFPDIESHPEFPVRDADAVRLIEARNRGALIGRGLGRSYGDSSLASTTVHTTYLDCFQFFDKQSGILRCSAGVSLASILELIIPEGWFLPVTPGTKYVTVGGAVASDVHGKNHHVVGCFSEFVDSITIATASGIVECSKAVNIDLFHATCGGMGLTGLILEVEMRLKRISSSFIQATTIKTRNLAEALEVLDFHCSATYSVAWIDCLSTGKDLGRSLVMLGEHAMDGELRAGRKPRLSVPCDVPGLFLNGITMQAFNSAYYHRVTKAKSHTVVPYDPYFYPLDSVRNWNRLYGRDGFLQYQFVIPREVGVEGMSAVLKRLAASKKGSFLAVLKLFGAENNNFLSFPMEGYTLALDLKCSPEVIALLEELDRVVVDFGGRIYLAKDARMSQAIFQESYPRWSSFSQLRRQWGAHHIFNSVQSLRLGL